MVGRERHAGRGQKFPEVPNIVLAAGAAVVRSMQMSLDTIQHHRQARTARIVGSRAKMFQQRLDFASVDVATDRLGINFL